VWVKFLWKEGARKEIVTLASKMDVTDKLLKLKPCMSFSQKNVGIDEPVLCEIIRISNVCDTVKCPGGSNCFRGVHPHLKWDKQGNYEHQSFSVFKTLIKSIVVPDSSFTVDTTLQEENKSYPLHVKQSKKKKKNKNMDTADAVAYPPLRQIDESDESKILKTDRAQEAYSIVVVQAKARRIAREAREYARDPLNKLVQHFMQIGENRDDESVESSEKRKSRVVGLTESVEECKKIMKYEVCDKEKASLLVKKIPHFIHIVQGISGNGINRDYLGDSLTLGRYQELVSLKRTKTLLSEADETAYEKASSCEMNKTKEYGFSRSEMCRLFKEFSGCTFPSSAGLNWVDGAKLREWKDVHIKARKIKKDYLYDKKLAKGNFKQTEGVRFNFPVFTNWVKIKYGEVGVEIVHSLKATERSTLVSTLKTDFPKLYASMECVGEEKTFYGLLQHMGYGTDSFPKSINSCDDYKIVVSWSELPSTYRLKLSLDTFSVYHSGLIS